MKRESSLRMNAMLKRVIRPQHPNRPTTRGRDKAKTFTHIDVAWCMGSALSYRAHVEQSADECGGIRRIGKLSPSNSVAHGFGSSVAVFGDTSKSAMFIF
jgi:hypothetical protein